MPLAEWTKENPNPLPSWAKVGAKVKWARGGDSDDIGTIITIEANYDFNNEWSERAEIHWENPTMEGWWPRPEFVEDELGPPSIVKATDPIDDLLDSVLE